MTGLEKLVHIHPGSHRALRRYLTPFYCFALGLMLILALISCDRKATATPNLTTVTQSGNLSHATSPALFGTQALIKSTRTPLPAIPATPNERTPSPLGVMAADLTGLQVNLWHPWTGATGTDFQTILDDFNRTNKWGITVVANAYEGFGSLDEAVDSALTSSTLPDVLVDYGYQARHWNESGVLADLAPYVDDPVWGLTGGEQSDFYPSFWAEDLVTTVSPPNSLRLGIPYYRSAYVLFYNQSWADELGYPVPPITVEDFRLQACAAAESVSVQGDKTNLGKGGWLITSEPGTLAGWIYAFGGEITNPNGNGYLFNTPETIQAFDYLKGLEESGCAWVDTGLEARADFAHRQGLFMVSSLFDIPSQRAAFTQAGLVDEWVVIPFPSNTQPVVDTYGPSILVTRSTPAKQLASWLVIEWLVYPPNQAEFVGQLEVYPTRQSTLRYLTNSEITSSQWEQALKLLPDSRGEPSLASWNMVRWVLNDATAQLFSLQFKSDKIPLLIENLDNVAEEIFRKVH